MASFVIPLGVISVLWLSVFRAYDIPQIHISDEVVRQGRESPPDSVLDELKDFDFLQDRLQDQQELMATASDLLAGNLRFENCSAHISLPFAARDLDLTPPACELPMAGFFVPDVFLRAYEASGREEFLSGAEAFILGAWEYERTAWLPRGQFWDDHAVSARVSVVANFWRLYRHSPGYRSDVALQIMDMVARAEALLAKPGLFTAATNHGIMQNLALWHASLAFPSLPHTREYQQLALARMKAQMKFYVSEEGVILEHSAGYQTFGLERLAWAFRYLDLMHQPVPEGWIEKYERAQKFYATLRRPDGSLPMFGDTDGTADQSGPPVATFDRDGRVQRLLYQNWRPAESANLYPVSGCSIWWDGLESWPNLRDLSQTVVTWSNFSGHGHKHADEMSLLFWAGGRNWWSNIGYWPYESKWRNTIESWPGSNAPHVLGESPTAPRTTRLMAIGSSDILTALDLERTGVGNFVARRQVVHWKPNFWLVLDSSSGGRGRTSITWTTSPDVRWQQGADGAFVLEDNQSDQRLDGFALGSQGTEQKLFRGSTQPFAGWQVEAGTGVPASALVIEQPATNSWAAMVWSWQKIASPPSRGERPKMTNWTNAENWEMRLSEAKGTTMRRQGTMLRLQSGGGDNMVLELKPPPDVAPQLAELDREFAAAASKYPRFFENKRRRSKVSGLLFVIFVLQEIFFFLYRRIGEVGVDILRILTLIVWIAGGIWLIGFYF